MTDQQHQISTKQLGGLVAILISIFTIVQFGQGWVTNIESQAYDEGRQSLQQELNTVAKEALQRQIIDLKNEFQVEIERLEAKEDEKHSQLEKKIIDGDLVVSDKVDEVKTFALAEVSGSRSDWNTAVDWLEKLLHVELSKKLNK